MNSYSKCLNYNSENCFRIWCLNRDENKINIGNPVSCVTQFDFMLKGGHETDCFTIFSVIPLGLLKIFFLSLVLIAISPETARSAITTVQDSTYKEISLNRLADLLELASENRASDTKRAIELGGEALQIAREQGLSESEAEALFYIAEAEFNAGDIEASLKNYLASAEAGQRSGGRESIEYAERIGDAGYCYFSLERYQEAIDLYTKSLEISLNNGYEVQAANMYGNIAAIYVHWGDFGKAIEYNKLALEIDRRLNDPVMISTDLNNIGKIYEQWNMPDEAIAYYRESLVIARDIGNPNMIAVRMNNIGSVFYSQKHYEEALDYFRQALEIERAMGSKAKTGRRLSYIGSAYLEMKDYPSALEYLNQALPLLLEVNLPGDLARVYNTFGSYYLATGDYSMATNWFFKSHDLAKQQNLKPLQILSLKGLSSSLAMEGKYMNAWETLQEMIRIKDSVFTQESNTRLAEFQARFENEKISLENKVLKKDARIRRNWYIFSGFIALTAVVILLSIILILRLRSRNLQQENEMARQKARHLQTELELKNKELTFKAMSIIQKNETVTDLLCGLETALKKGESPESLEKILKSIRTSDRDTSWKEFEVRFTQVHKEFYDKLNRKFPDLTPNERKLCAFLRLNMTTKDIASITHQSAHSINVARTRLRKKLNLSNSEENLITFLINL